jgi:hypothetical protein
MVIIQDENKDITGYGATLPKAMKRAGIGKEKYSYIRRLLWLAGYGKVIRWKDYYVSKWFN